MISWFEKNKQVSLIITAGIAICIFYISSIQVIPSLGKGIGIFPIIYHITAFFFLTLSLFISTLERKWDSKSILISLSLVTIYSILDELHQYFVPTRTMSVSDFFLDFTGIAIASIVYFILIFKKS